MNRFQIWWLHFRFYFWGDDEFERHGGKIPCKRCGRMFQSYNHYDHYDAYCEWCAFENRDSMDVKQSIQDILTAYDKDLIDWRSAKNWLNMEGIKIPQATPPPERRWESRIKTSFAIGGKKL